MLLYGLFLYVLVGLFTAIAFVIFGVGQVLPHGATMSAGARILIVPGATVLWPYVVDRWLKSGHRQ
jgi:hypothetical protein